jgi:hypothetical protein
MTYAETLQHEDNFVEERRQMNMLAAFCLLDEDGSGALSKPEVGLRCIG